VAGTASGFIDKDETVHEKSGRWGRLKAGARRAQQHWKKKYSAKLTILA
jgi:hypothetical protein